MSEVPGIPLADFVAGLRQQIRAAQQVADPDLPIEVGPITVEFTVLSRKEGEGHAGVKFWVIDAGTSGRVTGESTQKVTMILQPLTPKGDRARITDLQDTPTGNPNPAPPRYGQPDYE